MQFFCSKFREQAFWKTTYFSPVVQTLIRPIRESSSAQGRAQAKRLAFKARKVEGRMSATPQPLSEASDIDLKLASTLLRDERL
jgi:hypothetical protein